LSGGEATLSEAREGWGGAVVVAKLQLLLLVVKLLGGCGARIFS